MTWGPEDTAKMDTAAGEAETDLRTKMSTWTEEELRGATKLINWWSKHYLKAGHKRLYRLAMRILT